MNKINYDWKVSFNDRPEKPQGGFYSLYDIFYTKNADGMLVSRSSATSMVLNHDVICYDSLVYDSNSGAINTSQFNDWASRGIDVGPAMVDERAILHTDTRTDNQGTSTTIKYYSKEAYLKYDSLQDFMQACGNINEMTTLHISQEENWVIPGSGGSFIYSGFSVGNSPDTVVNILLTNPDDSIDKIYASEQTLFSSYNNIYINPVAVIKPILQYYINNQGITYKGFNAEAILSAAGVLKPDYIIENLDPQLELFLKNVYVFIRATFFADYIVPEVFQQDLTENSNVRHKNIIISGRADFNRFSDTSVSSPENSRFYHVQTAPSIDLISSKYAKDTGVTSYNNSNLLLTKIDSELRENYTKFGSVLYDNKNTLKKGADRNDNYLSAPQYFDPEGGTHTGASYINERPVLVPESGNLFIEGRAFGPSIDEIWRYFKQIVSGRIGDDVAKDAIDNGFIVNNNSSVSCNEDTTVTEGKQIQFVKDYFSNADGDLDRIIKIGDPISSEILPITVDDTAIDTLHITSWVTPPESFKLQVYEFLKDASKAAISGGAENLYIAESEVAINHGIQSVAPQTNSFSYKNSGQEFVNITMNNQSSPYAPRKNPYSLRELEAMLANTKYNINALMSFLVKNYTVNGSLAHGQSGLFQFHRDYNSQISSPNTLYKGFTADAASTEKVAGIAHINKKRPSEYGIGLPDDCDMFDSHDVYLAADGTWQYLGDTTRIRVIETEY